MRFLGGRENAFAHQRDDLGDELMPRRLAQPGKPVTEPEHLQDAAAGEKEARLGAARIGLPVREP